MQLHVPAQLVGERAREELDRAGVELALERRVDAGVDDVEEADLLARVQRRGRAASASSAGSENTGSMSAQFGNEKLSDTTCHAPPVFS